MAKGPDDYEVGYGKPPKHTQWPPGKSGNPKGKEKGKRGLKTDLVAVLDAKQTIRIEGKPYTGTRQNLTVLTLATRAAAGQVRALVASVYGPRLPAEMLNATAGALARRLVAVQRRHTARIDFKEMLYGANLPTEGVLADEVRSATLEAIVWPAANDLLYRVWRGGARGAVRSVGSSDPPPSSGLKTRRYVRFHALSRLGTPRRPD